MMTGVDVVAGFNELNLHCERIKDEFSEWKGR